MFYETDKNNHGLDFNPGKSLVSPRPIGWLSTLSPDGVVNLAPYSQFIMLNFDPPCVMISSGAHPDNNRLKDTDSVGWQLWSVCQDDPRRAASYAEKFALAHPVLLDGAELEVSRLYDPPSTPALYLIGGDGRIEFTSEGFAKDDLNEIGRRIADLAGSKAVDIAVADDGNPALKPGCMARQRMPRRRP